MIKLQLEHKVLLNFPAPVDLVKTQSLEQVKIRLTSQFQGFSKNYLKILAAQLF